MCWEIDNDNLNFIIVSVKGLRLLYKVNDVWKQYM